MRELHKLEPYDQELLEKAKRLIEKVYVYHYGDSFMRSELGRLKTIISKIEALQQTTTPRGG